MPSKKFGYERVSTKDQNEARQRESLLQMGIDERDIYTDKQSGKNFERPRYQLLKEMLREGDILYVHSLDRFGRNKITDIQTIGRFSQHCHIKGFLGSTSLSVINFRFAGGTLGRFYYR